MNAQMMTHSTSPSTAGGVGLLCTLALFGAGCGGPAPPPNPTGTAPEAEQVSSFYRFTDDVTASGEIKAYVGNRDMNVLYAPNRTPVLEVTAFDVLRDHVSPARPLLVGDDDSILLRDIVDIPQLSDDAMGIAVAAKSGGRTRFRYVPVSGRESALEGLSIDLSGLFEGGDREAVEAWAREVLPLPREHRSKPLTIPEHATLSFSIAFERVMQRRQGVPVRFSVTIVGEGISESIFEEELEPGLPGTWRKNARWHARNVDLSQYAGRNAEFVFRTAFARTPAEPETTSPVWGNPILHTSQPADIPSRPNVILVSLDTLRADHLGCYGYERPTSPNLDAFAQEAVLFERCLAPSSWTTPSHASLFTGWAPFVHEAGAHAGYRLQPKFRTLAEAASDNGYLTAAFTEGAAVAGQLGFFQGFGEYENGPLGLATPPGTAKTTFTQAEEWVRQFAHLPFLLFVHTDEIHWPYRVPSREWQKFSVPGENIESASPLTYEKEDFERWRNHYDDGIAYTDHVFGEFIQALETQGVLENTIVVVFSDHGEEFGEHDGTSHANSLYNEVLHVPFLIRLPGNGSAPVRVSETVMLTDLFATVGELAGLSVAPPASSISVVPVLKNPGNTQSIARSYRVSHLVQTASVVTVPLITLAIEDNRFKYILANQYSQEESPLSGFQRAGSPWTVSPFERAFTAAVLGGTGGIIQPEVGRILAVPGGPTQEYLFDWTRDRAEQINLAANPDFQATISTLRLRLDERLDALGKEAASRGVAVDKETVPMTSEEEERLRALGYR